VHEAQLHDPIRIAIPSLIKLIEDSLVRWEIVKVIGKLANHGEWQLESIAAQLTGTTKSNFVKPA
jgi:hypothetical protein